MNNIIVIVINKIFYIGLIYDFGFVWFVGDLNWREMFGLKFNLVFEKLCYIVGKLVIL